jgi:hypothetical protein
MTSTPSGFTTITRQFSQFAQPPTVYSSINKQTGSFTGDLTSYTSRTLEIDAVANSVVKLPEGANLTLQASTTNAINGNVIEFVATLTFADSNLDLERYVVELNIAGVTCSGQQIIQPRRAFTNQDGIARFTGQFNNRSFNDCRVNLVAITTANPDIRSQIISIAVSPSVNTPSLDLPVVSKISRIPQIETAFAALSDAFDQMTIQETVNLEPTKEVESGSQGDGIYNDKGKLSPKSGNPSSTLSWAYRAIQGFSNDQSRRHQAWSKTILHDTHSPTSEKDNSEFKVLGSVLSPKGFPCHSSYAELITEAGRFSAAANQAYLPDYAEGHSVKKTNAHEHYTCDQFRVQASTVFNINSATANIVSQQYLNQSRFHHIVADVQHSVNQHYWCRSEGQYVVMANCHTTYADNGRFSYSSFTDDMNGSHYIYSDEQFIQVGNADSRSLHETNFTSRYGHGVRGVYAENEINQLVGKGSYNVQSELDMNFRSNNGGIFLYTDVGVIELQSKDFLTLHSLLTMFIDTGLLNITASEVINIDAPIININSGFAVSPVIFGVTPLTASNAAPDQMRTPPSIPKEQPAPYAKRSQTSPKTPTPYSTLDGPDLQKASQDSPLPTPISDNSNIA